MSKPYAILAADPGAGYRAHRAEIDQAVHRVLESGWYILGREVEAFEREFAHYLGVAHAIGVASGTDGIELALRACEIGPGDLVVTVSHTAVATVAGIELAGAEPLLVDIDPRSYTMDPQSLHDVLHACASQPQLAGRVKAVVPVHLYGQPADMEAVLSLARRYGFRVIEDCSQAHGAEIGGRKMGTLGDVGVFSLYPTKNLAALGDGGIISTNDAVLAERLSLLRQYGWRQRNWSQVPGANSRLDELQAAILRVRLPFLDRDNASRCAVAQVYDAAFVDAPFVSPRRHADAHSVYHQYVIRTPHRDRLQSGLKEEARIQTLVHYPKAVHQQPAYKDRLRLLVALEHTESAVRQILSLPIFPELPLESARRVAQAGLSLVRTWA
jgi:dTDP-4-amino-4,6-dideoxygalactose transaminase